MAVAASKPPSPDSAPFAKQLSKFGKFWISNRGRNVVFAGSALLASGYFAGYVCLHSWFLTYYRDAVQLYKNGFMTPLTPGVFDRAKAALGDLKMSDKEKQAIKFFSVYGMDMFFAGSTKTIKGAVIGIPRNYTYKSMDDIERKDITVENNPVEWGSEGGELLKESLILSDNAQRFGIARNIAMSDTHYVYVRGAMGCSTVTLYYFLSRNGNEMLYGLYKPRSFRMVMYSALGMFCFGIWAVSSDILTKLYENYADKRAGSINLSYAKGGVEFYSKTLQRNIALRSIMGPSGEKLYTFFGNDIEFIRERHVPFTRRKHNLEKIAERLSVAGSGSMDNNENNDLTTDPRLLKS